MRHVIFILAILCCVIACLGCNTVKRAVDDYQVTRQDNIEYARAGVAAERVGDISNAVAVAAGVPVSVAELIDKAMTIMSCYLFAWHSGRQRRKLLSTSGGV